MPIFYKGAGPGTHWDVNNAQVIGFTAHSPTIVPTHNRMILHVARGTTTGPYISLTRSYDVAWNYAVYCGPSQLVATASKPGFVYEVELDDPLPQGVTLLDPVKEIAKNVPGPLSPVTYQHDGSQEFLLGVVRPTKSSKYLKQACRQPPPATGTNRPANLTLDLESLVRALRDAEILALGAIPAAFVRNRFSVHL